MNYFAINILIQFLESLGRSVSHFLSSLSFSYFNALIISLFLFIFYIFFIFSLIFENIFLIFSKIIFCAIIIPKVGDFMIIPNALKKGDIIGVIAPSDSIDKDDIEFINKSSKLFEDLGFKIRLSEFIFSNTLGYSASPLEKSKDVNSMFSNQDINALFIVKGGENSNTTFDYLDYELIKNNPKILCGFSDSTSITNMITEKTGLVTFSGATFKSLTSWETDYAFKEVVKRFIDKSFFFLIHTKYKVFMNTNK